MAEKSKRKTTTHAKEKSKKNVSGSKTQKKVTTPSVPKRERYFKLFDIKTNESTGRYKGETPKQAASKAYTKMIRSMAKNGQKIPTYSNIYLRESTRTPQQVDGASRVITKKKIYGYRAHRNPVTPVQKVTVVNKITGEEKEITHRYRNDIKKLTDFDPSSIELSRAAKKTKSKTTTTNKTKNSGSKTKSKKNASTKKVNKATVNA